MEWKRSEIFPDYEVSDEGRVRRLTPGRGARVGKEVSPWTDPDGRVTVTLRRDGETKTIRVATLVCSAFHGPRPQPRLEVCHNDGNPGNNQKDNLRWDTSAGNKADMVRHGTRLRGDKHPQAKLSPEAVAAIYKIYSEGRMTQTEIGKSFGINQSAVSKILNGKRWRVAE